jgi:hypothetical protein
MFTLTDLALSSLVLATIKESPLRIGKGEVSSTEESLMYAGLAGGLASRLFQLYDVYQGSKRQTPLSKRPAVRLLPNLDYAHSADQLLYGFTLSF